MEGPRYLLPTEPDRLMVDFGATPVTGIQTLVIEKLRAYFGHRQEDVLNALENYPEQP